MVKKKSKKNKRPIVINEQPVASSADNLQSGVSSVQTNDEPIDELAELNHEYAYVKRDVKKLVLMIGVLAILMVLIYFLETKSSVLTNFGDWIYKISHISL